MSNKNKVLLLVGFPCGVIGWMVLMGFLAPQGGTMAAILLILGLVTLAFFGRWVHKKSKQREEEERELMLVEQQTSYYMQAAVGGSSVSSEVYLTREELDLSRKGYHRSERLGGGREYELPKWMPKDMHKHW